MSSEKRTRLAIALMIPGSTSISPTVPTVPLPAARASRSSSTIASASGSVGSRRRSIGVAPAWSPRPVDDDVGVDVAGDRVDDADAVARVLEHARLLDVHLDPAGEVVEHVAALAPARRLVAGGLGVLPEAAPVVERAERLRSSSSVTRCAMIRLPSSIWPKPEPSSSRNEISWSGSPSRAPRSGGRPRAP